MKVRVSLGSSLVAIAAVSWGCASASALREASYVLPYPVGTSCELLQGYAGPWGHQGKEEFAYDFKMPVGSPVIASRAGTVVKTEASFEDGNRTPGKENYIFVAHGDGTFSRYYHLTRAGALVSAGERVQAGQPIGKSGDTGASAGPHLHFDVTRDCADWGCQTIPVSLENARENPLQAERSYVALPRQRRQSY